MKVPSRQWLWWGGGGMLLLAGALALVIPAQDWTAVLEAWLEEKNLLEAMLFFCAAYVIGTLLLVPSWIFPIAAGAAFGARWGIAASLASAVAGALAAFLIGRHLVRDKVERAAKRNTTFAAVDKAVRREPWKVVALLRLSPVLPSGLKSYFLGLTGVRTATYAFASAVGMLPGIAIKAYVGDVGREAITHGGPLRWALLAVGLAATIAITWLVGRFARKKLGF
jgi:uncharacterized membrane protein YdjX (TVP38/TMEM64 family)